MYHRIAEPASDVWETAVSPAHFEQHLQMLQRRGTIIPLSQLVDDLRGSKIKKHSVAITFDDGYLDNFLIARPLLEQYQMPATFFITAGLIGQEKEFWWDELEHIILFTEHLPADLSLSLGDKRLVFDLKHERVMNGELHQKHAHWKALQIDPPTLRGKLFMQLYLLLKPLPYATQQQGLSQLRSWANVQPMLRPAYRNMSMGQLQELRKNSLFTIGAHTMTHPALSCHTPAFQYQELFECKTFLKNSLGTGVDLLAYPYGNHDKKTISSAAAAQFKAAFTTSGSVTTRHSPQYQIGRMQVNNWNGSAFAQALHKRFGYF